jgi:Glycerophosphoryl diester phosphodiesterase
MEAFYQAADMGADGFELDLQFSKDGAIVVIHDDSIDRTSSGKGKVAALSLDELRRFDYGAVLYRDREASGEKIDIPVIDQVLELVRGRDLFLNIEIKDLFDRKANEELCEASIARVRAFGLVDNVIFSSFNHEAMARMKAAHPEFKTAFLYTEGLYRPSAYAGSAGASALHPYFRSVDAEIVDAAHGAGLAVNVWTADDPADMKAMAALGVDAIITNRPDLGVELRGESD